MTAVPQPTDRDHTERAGVDRTRPYFFVHVMKTGGSSFLQHIRDNFGPGEVYPDPALDNPEPLTAYTSIEELLGLTEERRRQVRAYTGHHPFVVTDLLGVDLVRITILRDPVERTISYLKDCRANRPRHHDMALEEIYEDIAVFAPFIWEHQAKIFSMTTDDRLHSYGDVLEIDDERLAIAKANLERVDVLGLAHRQDEVLAELHERYGWSVAPRPRVRVGQPAPVPESLRRQIVEDNPADMELWEFAQELHASREAGRRRAG